LTGEVGETPGDRLGHRSKHVVVLISSLGEVRLAVFPSLGDGIETVGEAEVGVRRGEVSLNLVWSAVGEVGVMWPMLGIVKGPENEVALDVLG